MNVCAREDVFDERRHAPLLSFTVEEVSAVRARGLTLGGDVAV